MLESPPPHGKCQDEIERTLIERRQGTRQAPDRLCTSIATLLAYLNYSPLVELKETLLY